MSDMRERGFVLAPWKWEVSVIVGGTPAAALEFVHGTLKLYDADFAEWALGWSFVQAGKPAVLWVHDASDIPTLVHEAIHVTSGILQARGLKHTPESEEAYTYTVESLLRAILECQEWDVAGQEGASGRPTS